MKTIFILALSVLLISCGQNSNKKHHKDNDFDCHCNVEKKATTANDIEKMRNQLTSAWENFSLKSGEHEINYTNPDEFWLFVGDDDCGYSHKGLTRRTFYMETSPDEGDFYYSIAAKDYKVIQHPKNDPELCKTLISRVQSTWGEALFSLMFLYLDAFDDDDGGSGNEVGTFKRRKLLNSKMKAQGLKKADIFALLHDDPPNDNDDNNDDDDDNDSDEDETSAEVHSMILGNKDGMRFYDLNYYFIVKKTGEKRAATFRFGIDVSPIPRIWGTKFA
ncbi:MAG: hypothetical protein KDD25_07935, partial [Bdellovibrionales bacterium]|nr:hypothetical protein [Bdellovibrionales bacterium]